MVVVLTVLAALSFRDAWAFKRRGRAADVTLQLPDRLKRRMHDIMRTRLRAGSLFLSALVIGVLVTLIEAVCTGQVYLPTLVLLSRYAETRARAFPLLLVYNLMFVVPLLVVIAAAFAGTRNQRLLEWSKRNVVWGKIAMGMLFIGLAAVLWAL
jgi:cytochrome c biogenesis protein CcdA